MAIEWNPRFVAYAYAHGRTPEDMLKHDDDEWPGGKMAGFILWITAHWSRWFIEVKQTRRPEPASSRYPYPLSDEDHANFTAWLQKQYLAPQEPQ